MTRKKKKGALGLAVIALAALYLMFAMTLNAFADSTIDTTWNGVNVKSTTATAADGYAYDETSPSGSSLTVTLEGDKVNAQSGQLVFKNTNPLPTQVSFDYTVSTTGGSVKNGDTEISGSGSVKTKLNANDGKLTINFSTNKGSSNSAKITISNLEIVVVETRTLTLRAAAHGSFTASTTNGDTGVTTSVTVRQGDADQSFTYVSTDGLNLSGTAEESGYGFYAWRDGNGTVLNNTSSTETKVPGNGSVLTAEFIPEGWTKPFNIGQKQYYSWEDAMHDAAVGASKKVSLACNYTLTTKVTAQNKAGSYFADGTYTIPEGVTFVVPFDDAASAYSSANLPPMDYVDTGVSGAYRILTIADNVTVTAKSGAVFSVPSKLSARGQLGSNNGGPYGYHGKVVLSGSNSNIVIENGAELAVFGYIVGNGTVKAESGSLVYECFQIRDWHGGTATKNAYNAGAFPFSQYYIQNIESKLRIDAGARELCTVGINYYSSADSAQIAFIGSGGLFDMQSGYLVKQYLADEDRLSIELYDGTATLGAMTIDVGVTTVNSEGITLPLNGNISIGINDGASVTVTQDVAMLAGAELDIKNGASLTIADNTTIIVYDTESENNTVKKLGYVASNNGAPSAREELEDASVRINGNLVVKGALYTTASGANIYSDEGTGSISYPNGAPTDNQDVKIVDPGSTDNPYKTCTATPARIKDANGEYVPTAGADSGLTYLYHKDESDDSKSCWYNYTLDWTDGIHTLQTDYIAVTETTEDVFSPGHTAFTGATIDTTGTATVALNNPIDAFIDGANFGTIAERVTVSGIDADAVVTLVTHPYQFKNTWNIMTYTDSMSPVNSQQIHYVNATTDSYDFGTDGSGQAYIVRAPGATNTTTYLAAGGTISASGSQATITGLTQDVTAYADGRNYSWYVNWLENGEASGTTSYLKTGETSATYSILARSGVKWIYQGNAVTGGSATVDGKTNTSITVTPTSDATVNVLTAAATNTYTYYIGDMAFELYANSQNYTFDGTTHTWTPASSSYKWRAASGTQSVTYEGDRYSVNNGTIKLINKSNQVVDMTVTLTNTATDSNVTGGQLIFTAPDGTTWNGTRTITMQPGRVMTITVGIDESSLDPNEIARTLDNVTFGTITVTAAVSDSAER